MKKIALIFLLSMCFIITGCNEKETEIFTYNSKEIIVNSNGFDLNGEIVYPITEKKVPAVIIVGGSGTVNMNGSIGNQTPYKDIAYGLSKNGIASIRCNKVNNQYITDIVKDYYFTIEDEYDYMIANMIKILKEDEKIDHDKIFLLGHSLGSQIIPKFLNQDNQLAGGIIMAGTTMHLLDLLLEQYHQQSEELYQTYLPYCNDLKTLKEVREGQEKYIYFGAYQTYWVDYNKLDLDLVQKLSCPLLIMQGDLDLQVKKDHFNNYKQLLFNKNNVSFKEYSKLNHLFTNGENENLNNAYSKNACVDDSVILDIAGFIKDSFT